MSENAEVDEYGDPLISSDYSPQEIEEFALIMERKLTKLYGANVLSGTNALLDVIKQTFIATELFVQGRADLEKLSR